MDIKKIYISGKITGLPVQEAIAKFRSAAEKIRRFGFEPVSPFDNGLPLEADWAEHIGKDISLLLRCDAIYLLDDYEKSEGARIELCIALHRRMPVFMNVRPKLGFFSVQTFEDYDKEKVLVYIFANIDFCTLSCITGVSHIFSLFNNFRAFSTIHNFINTICNSR